MIRPALFVLAASLASCLGPEEPALPPVGAAADEAARLACERRGGRFAPGGQSGGLTCFMTPPDAGKRCTRASDCSTQCLARSGTCVPITPLFGCNEILTDTGARLTQCID